MTVTMAARQKKRRRGLSPPEVEGGAPRLPAMQCTVLDRFRVLPADAGLREPSSRMGLRRWRQNLLRSVRVADRLRRDRLPKVELSVPTLRRAVLSQVRRSSVAQGLAAQSLRSPLHALRPAQVGPGSRSALSRMRHAAA